MGQGTARILALGRESGGNEVAQIDQDLVQLQDLVRYPREELGIEVKGWLDLSSEDHKADLAQAILALANHGGGHILIGFTDQNGELAVDNGKASTSLETYNQDLINGIVKGYADPPFQCSVYFVPLPDSEKAVPVVAVPGGHRVPIRCKRDGPLGKHVKQNVYYIRRPGPSSEPPLLAQEWGDLLGRCLRAGREDLLDDIRLILQGVTTDSSAAQQTEQSLSEWVGASEERFRSVLRARLPDEVPSRFSRGVWTFAYAVKGDFAEPSLQDLRKIVQEVQGHETGWPPWLVLSGRQMDPYPHEECVECFLGEPGEGASTSDFWRVSRNGRAFLLRGYQEDDEFKKTEPGTVFDLVLPVWRLGECLLHAERLAAALTKSETTLDIRASWAGLSGRIMKSWANHNRFLGPWYKATQDSVTSTLICPSRSVSANLPELVMALAEPLYAVFNFLKPPENMYTEELLRMRKG